MATPPDYSRFPGGTQDKGVNTFEPDIGAEITWDETTHNVTGGVRRGVGPRYGMSPIPHHSDSQDTWLGSEAASLVFAGLKNSEDPEQGVSANRTTWGLNQRKKIFGIVPLTLNNDQDLATSAQHYIWIVTRLATGASFENVDFMLAKEKLVGVNDGQYSPNIASGFYFATLAPTGGFTYCAEFITKTSIAKDVSAYNQALLPQGNVFGSYTSISVSGRDVPFKTWLGTAETVPDVDTAPDVSDTSTGIFGPGSGIYEIQTQQYKNTIRKFYVHCLGSAYEELMGYTFSLTPSSTTYVEGLYGVGSNFDGGRLVVSAATAVKIGAGTAYADVDFVYVKDQDAVVNSAYKSVLFAAKNPFATIIQEWYRNNDINVVPQYVDLTSSALEPKTINTTNYTEASIPTPTCFASFPAYIPGTPLAPVAALQVDLVASVTGQLEDDTNYEFTYSIFYKRLNHETNVGKPVKFYTGATGPYALKICDPQATELTNYGNLLGGADQVLLPPTFGSSGSPVDSFNFNFTEYRFYYRQLGTFEWLPAGQVDAADFWFGPFMADFLVCNAPIGSTIGGQPNGFNDYSPLATDTYFQTLTYKNRIFWFSDKSFTFSIKDSIFSYPTRHYTPAPTGKFRGGIVHIQPGETVQTSRIVIFASDQSYVGRFTGYTAEQSVTVSATESGSFPIEGSDFDVDYLCEATAFSYRSAVIAEGNLFFWGQQGVYMDDGITKPVNISRNFLEPELFDYIDQSQIDAVHCVYNAQTKEIIWFYPPKTADADYPTYGLVFNITNGNFYPLKFTCQVDAAQVLKIEDDSSPPGVAGERIVVHVRETSASTVQRSFFFDNLCKSGDMVPGTEMMVKTIATPVTGQRRLTLATGHPNLTSIVAGDFIALQNARGYAPALTAASDMITKVVAVNNGSSYIDILLPTGGSLDGTATITTSATENFFPIWHMGAATAGLNGIPWQIQTNYWLPNGMADSWLWQYLYLLFKFNSWPAPLDLQGRLIGTTMDLAYRTLVSSGETSDTLALVNNSDNHCQIHHQLRNGDMAATGQALKYRLSGIHIGQVWTLEYLEANLLLENGFTLKEFEG